MTTKATSTSESETSRLTPGQGENQNRSGHTTYWSGTTTTESVPRTVQTNQRPRGAHLQMKRSLHEVQSSVFKVVRWGAAVFERGATSGVHGSLERPRLAYFWLG